MFLKRCSEVREQYFWDFSVRTEEKISRWKNLFVFQWLMFLYQLVNLVLETCFIFSKILKFKARHFFFFFVLVLWTRWIIRSTGVMIPLFQIIFGIVFKKVNSWVFGVFYKVNCSVDLGFLTHLFSERCLNRWLVKEIITLSLGRHVKRLKIVIMACGSLTFSLSVFEEKSPYRVGRHVEYVTEERFKFLAGNS